MLKHSSRRRREVVAAVELAILVFVLGAPLAVTFAPTARAATNHVIEMSGFAFSPQFLTIPAGDTVQWHNADGLTHTSIANATDPDTWSFTSVGAGTTTSQVTLTIPGEYNYYCSLHFALYNMWGRITVTGGTGVPEFSSSMLAVVGMLGIVLGLMFVRKKT